MLSDFDALKWHRVYWEKNWRPLHLSFIFMSAHFFVTLCLALLVQSTVFIIIMHIPLIQALQVTSLLTNLRPRPCDPWWLCLGFIVSLTHLVFHSQCNFTAIRNSCNIWRTYWDIQDAWSSVRGVLTYFQKHGKFVRKYAGPGGWNDPDMVTDKFILFGHFCWRCCHVELYVKRFDLPFLSLGLKVNKQQQTSNHLSWLYALCTPHCTVQEKSRGV